ncbi:golgin-84 isoform X2 [Phymastichus coffea]|uniref:golgin-84 isoform X2 n=1 Tax=Phymastichus coffea TaxID=108790 RepID=UPI00273BD64E|nr:golgin-84 isoform X2 [Phymastichus coffea]
MAWLSDLAGKAEEVLNNIDKTTAAVLKKEDAKRDSLGSSLVEVRSLPPNSNFTVEEFLRNEERYSDPKVYTRNSPFPTKMTVSAPPTPAHTDRSMNLQNESLAWLDNATISNNRKEELIDTPSNNGYKSNESYDDYQMPDENENGVGDLTQYFNANVSATSGDKEQQVKAEYTKEIESLRDKINTITSERTRFIREISDLTSTLEKTRFELNAVESELEQHRARALRTLQERDKLISELRSNSTSELDDTSVLVELNQLRQEREVLREENRQIREKLRLARQEAIDAELNSEKVRQRAMEAGIQARESIANERRRRLDAEEDAKLRSEEVNSLREELTLRHNSFLAKIQKQESEISRLRSQLSAATTPNSEVESRLSSLTRTLVLKQQELEHLTTDRNALRLQLEKLEHEYQNWRKSMPFSNVNDTDDAKALLPSFLMESPFDTGVARKVKRAYSSLDAVGIRIGVFLRRYPLARIFVIIYIALLQFWVLIVLFSQSPEAR